MYIWILLATIMVALSFFNVSPRVDKEHALNEIRAATVTNRFKAEHEAMLKTMECEIMKNRNNGCWDTENRSAGCMENTPRQSAIGPVNVGCFNPGYVRLHSDASNSTSDPHSSCANINPFVEKTIDGVTYKMQTFSADSVHNTKANYTSFWEQMPIGYEILPTFFPKGIYHYVVCLDEAAEKVTASNNNFIRCDMKRDNVPQENSSGEETVNDEVNNTDSETDVENDGENTGTTPHSSTTQKHLSGHTRYLVTFAQIPEKWLSKDADRYPLPVLVNMLSKDIKSDTVYGWTICKHGSGTDNMQCQLSGVNARHGNTVRKEDKRQDNKGVSVDLYSVDISYEKDDDGEYILDDDGNKIQHKKYVADHIYEYETLPRDSVFWSIPGFQEVCRNDACLFAYEEFPNTDTAFHCENMMTGQKNKNTGVTAHNPKSQ